MLWDEEFFDQRTGVYTVDAFLRNALEEYGGFDSLVLWQAYPRLGADDRNQFDFYRDMPGGIDGLRSVVRICHAYGVKTFLVYNPWDTGTRREGVSDDNALVSLVKAIEVDGVFLDTMAHGSVALRSKLDEAGSGLILEGEDALPLQRVHDHSMSWAQQFHDSVVPGILRNKWFERRHMQHQADRWNPDRIAQLHIAWMNGSGMLIWDNVFGTIVPWNARDRSLLRMMVPVQRRYADLFSGEGWIPLIATEKPGLFASQWEHERVRLWTLVNRSNDTIDGIMLKVRHDPGSSYYDVIQGIELYPPIRNGLAFLASSLLPKGIGGFVAGMSSALGHRFVEFLGAQRRRYARHDKSEAISVVTTALRSRKDQSIVNEHPPSDMTEIAMATFRMRVEFQTRECGFYGESYDTPLLYPNLFKPHVIERLVTVPRYAIDLTPVTNAQYQTFLQDTRYRPRHMENFLKHWRHGGPPDAKVDHPVVYVDIDDARAYATWAGKRLPTEEQWQYAAQGPQGLKYPWGNEMQSGRCNGGEGAGTTAVRAYPDGRSPFGCFDMCGNTWEWTDSERSDTRTRFCIIRGGSFYTASGSHWYMDGGPRPNDFAAKFILMWPGLNRCGTIGFRCILDLT